MMNRNALAGLGLSAATRKGQAALALVGLACAGAGLALVGVGGVMAMGALLAGVGAGWAFGARHGARAAGAASPDSFGAGRPAIAALGRESRQEAFSDPQPASREQRAQEAAAAMSPRDRAIAAAEDKISRLLALASESGIDSNIKRKTELVGGHAQKILEIARLSKDGITIAGKLEEAFVASAHQLVEKYARLRKLLTGSAEKQQATISALRGLDMVIDGLSQFRDSALKDDIRALESEVSMLEHNLRIEGLDLPKSHRVQA